MKRKEEIKNIGEEKRNSNGLEWILSAKIRICYVECNKTLSLYGLNVESSLTGWINHNQIKTLVSFQSHEVLVIGNTTIELISCKEYSPIPFLYT